MEVELGVLSYEFNGLMEYWTKWNIGIMEGWNIGKLEGWKVGIDVDMKWLMVVQRETNLPGKFSRTSNPGLNHRKVGAKYGAWLKGHNF